MRVGERSCRLNPHKPRPAVLQAARVVIEYGLEIGVSDLGHRVELDVVLLSEVHVVLQNEGALV